MRQAGLALFFLLIFSFSSCTKTSKKDQYFYYLEEILGQDPVKTQRYVLVSDYSCSSCREQVYWEIEEKPSATVYIILQPRNKAVLQDRFQKVILENRLFIDSTKRNMDRGLIVDQVMEIIFQGGEWVAREAEWAFEEPTP